MKQRVTVAEAARRLGKSELFIREALKRGILPIGVAIQLPGNSKYSYHISPKLLAEYLGEVEKNERVSD